MRNSLVLLTIIMDFCLQFISTKTSSQNNIKIIRSPQDYFPKSGNLQLFCEAEGNPSPTITWYDAQTMFPVDEEKSINSNIYKDNGFIIIEKPVDKEIYEFYCNASNKYNWVISNIAKTGRAFLSTIFKLEPIPIQVVNPSQNVLFSCQPPTGIPDPNVHWLKNKKIILNKTYSKDVNRISFVNVDKTQNENEQWSLRIKKVNIEDSGRYQCIAINDFGRVESSVSWLIVTNDLETSFNVKIDTKFINLGQDISFLCNSEHENNIRWISSKNIALNNRINISTKFLIIRDIKVLDNGIYACETNTSTPQLLKIYKLNVGSHEVTEDKTRSRKKVVIEGVNVILECELENSQTGFYWETPSSQPIFPQDLNHSRLQVISNGNLIIKGVQSSDSGKYTCNTHSSLDVAHKSVWLEVSKHQLELYPVISIPCQNLTVLQNSNIHLRCEVIGEDIIKVIWYRGLNIKQRLVNNEKISFPTKDSVKIANSNIKEDSNFYTCEAINEQGRKATWTSFVDVVESYQMVKDNQRSSELPLPPVVESPKNIKSTSLELIWSSSGIHEIGNLYWIEYVYFGANGGWTIYKKDWKYNSIIIENLIPDTWYQFLVRTKNKSGIGRASVPTEYVKTKQDDNFSGNIGFSFSKIKLHIPRILNNGETRLIWSLNRIRNNEKSETPVQFYVLYRPVSILQCIVSMSNNHEVQTNFQVPVLGNYCSLTFLTSEKLKSIKDYESGIHSSNIKLPINFSKTNLTQSRDLNYENFAKMSWMLMNVTAFNCYNISIISEKGFQSVNSNTQLILTPESRPSRPPENVQITWVLPEISININWQIPHRKFWNGILTGSNIYMKSNESEIVLKYNSSQPNKLIKRVNSDLDWVFQISISNCVGESKKSLPVILKRLTSSLGVQRLQDSIFKKTWMIVTLVITSLLIWIMLCFLAVYLCCIRSNDVQCHKLVFSVNDTSNEIGKNTTSNGTCMGKVVNNVENENILHDVIEDKSSSNNCASSAKSSGQSSSPSSVSFCNPYASTQLFEGVHENKSTDLNLFYLSTPIFEPLPVNKTLPIPLNYYLSNVPDWVGNPILTGSFQQNPKLFPFRFPEEFRTNSNNDLSKTQTDKPNYSNANIDDNIASQNGTLSNLLISTAPFSDHFSASSKGKSTPNSSNSDSTQLTHMDILSRYGPPNIHSKSIRRRQDNMDLYDQSTEMTHLLIDNNEKNSPSMTRVYDTPYSESSVDSRKKIQSKE